MPDIFHSLRQERLDSPCGPVYYWIDKVENSGPPLVFLPGLTADHTLFTRQAEYYRGRRSILVWDTPAHGLSRPYDGFSYTRFAGHLKEILEREGLSSPVLVAQSMGGFIAQAFIDQYPGETAGFVAVDTCPLGWSWYSRSDIWWLRQVEWMARCFPHKLLVQSIAASCTRSKEARASMAASLAPYGKRELCRLMGAAYTVFLEENREIQIDCPVLILVGEKDKTGKVMQYCRAWNKATGYPMAVIPGAAHNSNYDQPDAVNRLIDGFLERLETEMPDAAL